MMYLAMILGALAIGLGIGLMDPGKPKDKKPWKPKRRSKGRRATTYPGYTSYS